MSDWAEGLAEAFTPPADISSWTSGYDLPAGASVAPVTSSFDILTGANSVIRTITGLVTARDSYQDNRLDRSVARDVKLMNAQTARDVAGIQAQTVRANAMGGLNYARLQAQPSQFGLGNAANDRLMLLLAAVGVVIAVMQYTKSEK